MKILNVVKTNRGAGWAFIQAEWIKKHHPEVEITTVIPEETGGFAEEYKKIGCEVIASDFSLPVKKPWKIWGKKREIQKLVETNKYDIIHTHFVTNTLMIRIALKNKGPARVFQVPGPLHLEHKLFAFADKITIKKNDYLVGSCQWTADKYLQMGIPKDKVFLNYYGGEVSPLITEGDALHKDLNISDKKQIIGMVSYFYKPKRYLFQFRGIKGHEDFIDAIALLRKERADVIGVIVGNAWKGAENYEQHVHEYAMKNCPNGIIFAGFRNDVNRIYHEMKVAVHPSLSENIGGAAQSLCQQVSTVTTNIGGFPDVVKDGIDGWTVNPGKPKELAEKIGWMLDHEGEAKDRMLCESLLTIEKTGENMYKIYNTINEARSGR